MKVAYDEGFQPGTCIACAQRPRWRDSVLCSACQVIGWTKFRAAVERQRQRRAS